MHSALAKALTLISGLHHWDFSHPRTVCLEHHCCRKECQIYSPTLCGSETKILKG